MESLPESLGAVTGTDAVPATPASPRRAKREQQLIEAALDCISTLGLRETTVQDISTRADMATGSINQYFETKERLLIAALRSLSEEFETTWRRALAAAGTDPARRLRRFVDCYFDPTNCQRRKIAVWFAFWGEVKARPTYREVCAGYDRTHDATLDALCSELIAAGHGGPLAAAPAAKIVASVCQGLWLEFLTGTDGLRREELAALAHSTLAALFPPVADRFAAHKPMLF